MFQHLAHTAGELLCRKSLECGKVGINQGGMMESSHHILVTVEIHAGFSADAAVYLGQQSGGDLDEINATKIGSSRITCQIAGDTSAQGGKNIFTVKMSLNEVAVELSHSVKIFGGFARRKGKNAYPGKTFFQNRLYRIQIEGGYRTVSYDTDFSLFRLQSLDCLGKAVKIFLQVNIIRSSLTCFHS